jgi:hypothetical protein
MAAPKRSKLQRERDLQETARLYLRGWTQLEIGQKLGVDRSQISKDLKVIVQRWRDNASTDIAEIKLREVTKINALETDAWAAWDRSCQNAETTVTTLSKARSKTKGAAAPDAQKIERTTKTQPGDPRFMERIAWCISKRCEIFGVEKAKESKVKLEGAVEIKTPDIAAMNFFADLGMKLQSFPEAKKVVGEFIKRRVAECEAQANAADPIP